MTDQDTDQYAGPGRDLDRDETAQDTGTEAPRSRLFRAARYLAQNFVRIIGTLLVALLLVTTWAGYDVPRNIRIIGIAAGIVAVLIGQPVASRVVSWLWEPSYVWLIDLDAQIQKGGIYRVPIQRFREWDVRTGTLDWLSPNLAVGKDVDLIEQAITGTWRGTMSDRDLLRALEAVKECRGRLEDDAKRGFKIETHAHGIIRRAVHKATLRLVSTFERGSLPDKGEGLTEEIDDVLEEFDLERGIRRAESDDSPVSDVAGLDTDLDPDLEDLATAGRSVNGVSRRD